MAAFSTIAIVGLGIMAASAYGQYEAGKDAADAQRGMAASQQRQAEIAQRQADIQNARTQRAAIRQARIARATVLNTGASAGTMESSGVLGGVGSVTSQERSNLGFFNQIGQLQAQTTESKMVEGQFAGDYATAQGRSAEWGALGSLGSTIFSAAGGYRTIFGGNKGTADVKAT